MSETGDAGGLRTDDPFDGVSIEPEVRAPAVNTDPRPNNWFRRNVINRFSRGGQQETAAPVPEPTKLSPELFHINQAATEKYRREIVDLVDRKGLVGTDEVVVSFDGSLDNFVALIGASSQQPLQEVNAQPYGYARDPLSIAYGFRELKRTGIELMQPLSIPKGADVLSPTNAEQSHQRVEVVGAVRNDWGANVALLLPEEFSFVVPTPGEIRSDGPYKERHRKLSDLSMGNISGNTTFLQLVAEHPFINANYKESIAKAEKDGALIYRHGKTKMEGGYVVGSQEYVKVVARRISTNQTIRGDYVSGGNVISRSLSETGEAWRTYAREIVVPASLAEGLASK